MKSKASLVCGSSLTQDPWILIQEVAVLIPTINEEATLGRVIDRIPFHALSNDGYNTAIYAVDGDSEDETRQKALENGA